MHRCRIHCPGGGDGFIWVTVLAFVGAVYVLWQVAMVLAVALAVAFVVVAALAVASRALAWRWSVAPFLVRREHYAVPVAADMRAIRRGSLAIEAPAHAVVPVITAARERAAR